MQDKAADWIKRKLLPFLRDRDPSGVASAYIRMEEDKWSSETKEPCHPKGDGLPNAVKVACKCGEMYWHNPEPYKPIEPLEGDAMDIPFKRYKEAINECITRINKMEGK